MKVAAFAFIVGLCLVAVNANASDNFGIEYEDVQDYEYVAQKLADEIMEIESRGLFSGMYFVLKKVLQTLKGLNCTIKEVTVIYGAVNDFVNNVKACGGEVSVKVQTLVVACNDIIETCKTIFGINESICGNTNDENETKLRTWNVVSGALNGHKCFVKMFGNLQTLNKQIKNASKLITQIKKAPGDTSKCVLVAVDTLEGYFSRFSSNIKTCSKLVSNKMA